MRTLVIDIENRPNLAYCWGLWDQNISIGQIAEVGETFSFAAQWVGEKKVHFYSTYHHGKREMLEAAHAMLSEADVVVGWNSKAFDMKHLNKEFILDGMTPPEPYAQIDLMLVVRKQFKFASNKLDFVAQQLGLGAKTQHSGFQLWLDCMAGKESAWALMRKYNRQDVRLTTEIYHKLLPWITSHPNRNLYDGLVHSCPNCGSDQLQKRGFRYTAVSKFQQFICKDCGAWSKGNKRIDSTDVA